MSHKLQDHQKRVIVSVTLDPEILDKVDALKAGDKGRSQTINDLLIKGLASDIPSAQPTPSPTQFDVLKLVSGTDMKNFNEVMATGKMGMEEAIKMCLLVGIDKVVDSFRKNPPA